MLRIPQGPRRVEKTGQKQSPFFSRRKRDTYMLFFAQQMRRFLVRSYQTCWASKCATCRRRVLRKSVFPEKCAPAQQQRNTYFIPGCIPAITIFFSLFLSLLPFLALSFLAFLVFSFLSFPFSFFASFSFFPSSYLFFVFFSN